MGLVGLDRDPAAGAAAVTETSVGFASSAQIVKVARGGARCRARQRPFGVKVRSTEGRTQKV